jgi:hypothetical protein
VKAGQSAQTTFVLGILAVATGVIFLGVLFGPMALIGGAVAQGQLASSDDRERDRKRIRLGTILGAIGLALSVAMIVLVNVVD